MTTRADQYRANASEAEYQWGNCKVKILKILKSDLRSNN